jgi:Cu2+-exporting ATPase
MMHIGPGTEVGKDPDEFFIGYAPRMPPRLARFVTKVVVGLACGVSAWAVTVAAGHVRLEGGTFEFGHSQRFAGTIVERPYPALRLKVVSPGFLREQNIAMTDKRVEQLQTQGKTVVFVLVDGKLRGAIALADIIRPESKQAIAALKEMNIRCMMLTGDNKPVAQWVSDQIGLDEYFAEVLPQDKAAKVKEVQSRGQLVAMTGDGVNDAPALAQADLGIAIGAGSDVAVETADVILVRSNPSDVVAILKLSRATYSKMVQNLFWATGYNAFALPLAAGALYAWGVLLSPALGAVLMSASTIIVAINARLLRIDK